MSIFKYAIVASMLATMLVSCASKKAYYEQVGGDPRIDFIEFMNDSVVRYMGPGGIEQHCKYVCKGNQIVIYITPMVTANLYKIDGNTIQGEVPFFEGTWKKK